MIETPMQAYEKRAAKQRVKDAARDARYAAYDAETARVNAAFEAATKRAYERGDFSAKPLQQAAAKIGEAIAERAKTSTGGASPVGTVAVDHRMECNPGAGAEDGLVPEVRTALSTETRQIIHPAHEARLKPIAEKLAGTMRARGVTAADARLALLGAVTKTQRAAERLARQAAAQAAGCKRDYIPSDETCREAVRLLEFAEGK